MSAKPSSSPASRRNARGGAKLPPGPDRQALADPKRPARIYRKLLQLYPDATCALQHGNAFELLAATILSAQCTDERVNKVTPELFRRYPTIAALAEADLSELEQVIRSTGFFRNKAKAIRGAAAMVMEKFGGRVPQTMEELLELPGVARKTANVVLGNAFDRNVGVVVDTHVGRLSQRLGFTRQSDPVKIERDLIALFPRRHWTMLAHLLIAHGRKICVARRPRCWDCPLAPQCPKMGVTNPQPPGNSD